MKLHECTMKIQEWKTETTSLMDFFIIQTFTMMIMTKKNDAEEDDVRDNIKYGDDQNEQKNDEDENVEGKDLGDKKMNK